MQDAPFPDLRDAIARISPLSSEAVDAVVHLVVERSARPAMQLLRAGDVARSVFFVRSGLLREYYVDRNGREATRRFCGALEFSGSLADLLAQKPAAASIEILAPCELLEFSWATLDALTHHHPTLMLLMRRMAEGLYVQKMHREFEMLTLPAVERYQRFVQSAPTLHAKLPRHMVASYLGITPVHLSRISAGGKLPTL